MYCIDKQKAKDGGAVAYWAVMMLSYYPWTPRETEVEVYFGDGRGLYVAWFIIS